MFTDPSFTASPPPPLPAAPPPRPDRTRAGSVWVSATGAFLLFAAAAVFVAVQWSVMADELKFAVLASLTGATLLAGRRSRVVLPATSGVVFHLGALLIPVNVAAIARHLELSWPAALLSVSVSAAASWWALSRLEDSSVLRWSAAIAALGVGAGVAAVSGAPTPLVVAAMAVGAQAARSHRCATGWALVAGLAPALGAIDWVLANPRPVLATLGLVGARAGLLAAVSGAAAAAVLARQATRRRDLVLVGAAAASLLIGVGQAWTGLRTGPGSDALAMATMFLLIEIVAQLLSRDEFWARPARVAAQVSEVVAGTLTVLLAVGAIAAVASGTEVPLALASGVVGAVAWLVGDARRIEAPGRLTAGRILFGGGWGPAVPMAMVALSAGVGGETGSATAVAITLVVTSLVAVVSGRPGAHSSAAVACVVAPFAVQDGNAALVLVGIAATVAVTLASVVRGRMGGDENAQGSWALAAAAVTVVVTTWALVDVGVDTIDAVRPSTFGWWLAALTAVLVVLAVVLDRSRAEIGGVAPGTVGRVVAGAAAVGAGLAMLVDPNRVTASDVLVVSSVATVLLLVWAVLSDRPFDALVAAVTAPIAAAALASVAGYSIGDAGVAAAMAGVVAGGVHPLVSERWRPVTLSAQLGGFVLGLLLVGDDPAAMMTLLTALGGLLLVTAIIERSTLVAALGWLSISAGIWGHLSLNGVHALDAYALPVAAGLLAMGHLSRRQLVAGTGDGSGAADGSGVSSWVAYGPAIVVMGGTAIIERLAGGGGVHALVAGVVAVAAVALGGYRRLAGPLVLGTGLVVALTVHESLTVTALVPTWGWLALGGTVLVAAGVAMERAETGPRETGQRIVDTVRTRYS